jgi:hypothetical protein
MTMSGHKVLALRDGTCVQVRGVRAGDAEALQRLVGRSSDRSVELRFSGSLKALSDEMAERFADVDGEDRFGLVALDPRDRRSSVSSATCGKVTGPSTRRSLRTGFREGGLGSV